MIIVLFFYGFNSFGDFLFFLLKSFLKKLIGFLNDGICMVCDFLVFNFRIGFGKDGLSLYWISGFREGV